MLEPIQGEAGVYPAGTTSSAGSGRSPRRPGCFLILDEIQTDIGRTGRFFAFEHAASSPTS